MADRKNKTDETKKREVAASVTAGKPNQTTMADEKAGVIEQDFNAGKQRAEPNQIIDAKAGINELNFNVGEQVVKKRKVSLNYKVWLIGLLLFFTAFFCILVFQVRIFEKFDKAKVIAFEDDGLFYKITYIVEGNEYEARYSTAIVGNGEYTQSFNGKLEYIEYQVSDPTYTFINRNKELIPLVIFDSLFLLGIIPLTIYEVKKGFKI